MSSLSWCHHIPMSTACYYVHSPVKKIKKKKKKRGRHVTCLCARGFSGALRAPGWPLAGVGGAGHGARVHAADPAHPPAVSARHEATHHRHRWGGHARRGEGGGAHHRHRWGGHARRGGGAGGGTQGGTQGGIISCFGTLQFRFQYLRWM